MTRSDVPHMRVITNRDGQVVISARPSGTKPWKWYTFNDANEIPLKQLQATVSKIQGDTDQLKKLSFNGSFENYEIDGIYVNVSPPLDPNWNKPKCSRKEYVMVHETPEMYSNNIENKIVSPEWVTRIESGNAEEEILMETPDFFLLPNFKWNRKIKDLYLLTIFKDKALRSIRDLNFNHIDLLEKTKSIVLDYVSKKFHLHRSHVRCFFHYYPSAWRLHLHVQHVSANTSLGSTTQCGRAHILEDVMNNIKLLPNYYQIATISSVLTLDRFDGLYK